MGAFAAFGQFEARVQIPLPRGGRTHHDQRGREVRIGRLRRYCAVFDLRQLGVELLVRVFRIYGEPHRRFGAGFQIESVEKQLIQLAVSEVVRQGRALVDDDRTGEHVAVGQVDVERVGDLGLLVVGRGGPFGVQGRLVGVLRVDQHGVGRKGQRGGCQGCGFRNRFFGRVVGTAGGGQKKGGGQTRGQIVEFSSHIGWFLIGLIGCRCRKQNYRFVRACNRKVRKAKKFDRIVLILRFFCA